MRAESPWCRRFRKQGCRFTIPRQAVADILISTPEHLSAEDIYFKLHTTYPGVGLTTVYRTLELLCEMGMARKLDFGDGRCRYEIAEGVEGAKKPHHHHLICTKCGKIIDYDDFISEERKLFKQLEETLSEKHGFSIYSHNVSFYGICRKCARN